MLKKFAQEKDEKGRKLEYMARKKTRNEDARKYYTVSKKSLVEFMNAMLLGLYNAEMRKTYLIFMPKEIKHEREIKTVLDHQLINLKT